MATGQQQRATATRTQQGDGDFERLMKGDAKLQAVFTECKTRAPTIEECLPDFMKGQSGRLIQRAMLTMQRNRDLQGIDPQQFARLVVEAAELGFAIDGKNVYVVNFKGTYQLMPSYKAMVAFCKRCRTLVDVQCDVVCKNDLFEHRRDNGSNILQHTFQLGAERGEVIGAYCRVWLPGGLWNYALMDRDELDSIQRRAASQNGPWKTDANEMRKKTVIRRALKLYQDDPGVARLMEATEWEDELETELNKPATRQTVAEILSRPVGKVEPKEHTDPITPDHEPPPHYSTALAHDWIGRATTVQEAVDAATALDALKGANKQEIDGIYIEKERKLKGGE